MRSQSEYISRRRWTTPFLTASANKLGWLLTLRSWRPLLKLLMMTLKRSVYCLRLVSRIILFAIALHVSVRFRMMHYDICVKIEFLQLFMMLRRLHERILQLRVLF
mmetsp:Transcript_10865/g.47064  ORF Transcript_10865/g.47064 Transcript_10865/m.47064 type:complete len:106 (+) Transcript_10865:698-1015(+)